MPINAGEVLLVIFTLLTPGLSIWGDGIYQIIPSAGVAVKAGYNKRPASGRLSYPDL